jgi:hypothetical protein
MGKGIAMNCVQVVAVTEKMAEYSVVSLRTISIFSSHNMPRIVKHLLDYVLAPISTKILVIYC